MPRTAADPALGDLRRRRAGLHDRWKKLQPALRKLERLEARIRKLVAEREPYDRQLRQYEEDRRSYRRDYDRYQEARKSR